MAVHASNMDNANSPEYLEKIKVQVIENIKRAAAAPSVQLMDVPRDPEGMDDEHDAEMDDLDEDENKDTRYSQRRWDKHTEKDGELSDSENEDANERNGVRRISRRKRMNIMDYQNPNALPDDDDSMTRNRSRGSNEANGDKQSDTLDAAAVNGSRQPSKSPKLNGDSPSADNAAATGDGDVEMDEGSNEAPAIIEGPQGPSPPQSPPQAAIATTAVADEDHLMDEAETAVVAQANGIAERDQENTTAEQSTEIAKEEDKA